MRLCSDDIVVAQIAQASRGSRAFLSALGRLLAQCPAAAARRFPLASWACADSDAVLVPNWRDLVAPVPASLWSELDFLLSLGGFPNWQSAGSDPFTALLSLRGRVSA